VRRGQLLASKIGREAIVDVVEFLRQEEKVLITQIKASSELAESILRGKISNLQYVSKLAEDLEWVQTN